MGNLFLLVFLCTPFLFAIGMVNPALFTKVFGKLPTRLLIAKASGALFVGSFIGAGVTLDPPPSSSSQEVLIEENAEPVTEEVPDLTKPLAETPVPAEESTTVEQSTPEINSPSSYVEPEPVVQELVYVPPVVEAEPELEAPSYICSYNAYNCSDFSSWYEANQVYNYCLSIGAGDIHDLDRDNDGACDSLK